MLKKKIKNKNGFTMAELLIVIAILGVLAAITIVGIVNYQRTLTKTEYDSYAKEIFIAAQNHLAEASSQGYFARSTVGLGVKENAINGIDDTGNGIYYYVIQNGTNLPESQLNQPAEIISYILPFGAIDESVRGGGSYIIRYHKDSGQILDVFYWTTSGRYAYLYDESDYSFLLSNRGKEHKDTLTNYNNAVIGYYGGTDASNLSYGEKIIKPKLFVRNGDTLSVFVTDENSDNPYASLKLLITGVTSKAKKEIKLKSNVSHSSDLLEPNVFYNAPQNLYAVILDDITRSNLHFSQLFCDNSDAQNSFIEGEDLLIEAVAYNSYQLSNIERTEKISTNSLFEKIIKLEKIIDTEKFDTTVSIQNIRHLENLDPLISHVNTNEIFQINSAQQTSDIDWNEFQSFIAKQDTMLGSSSTISQTAIAIYECDGTMNTKIGDVGYFYPVQPKSTLIYDGKDEKQRIHSISHVQIKQTDESDKNAGIFDTLIENSVVQNLIINDCIVEGKVTGSLAGKISDTKIDNVIGLNLYKKNNEQNNETTENALSDNNKNELTFASIRGSDVTGGLIGMAEQSVIQNSAASFLVESEFNMAGGLVGKAEDSTVRRCYSGGHTKDGQYLKESCNVNGFLETGGFIGYINNAIISDCYSTCSACGKGISAVGGFVGAGSGLLTNCYATGYVFGAPEAEGGFSGHAITNQNQQACFDCGYLRSTFMVENDEEETAKEEESDDDEDEKEQFWDEDDNVLGVVALDSSLESLSPYYATNPKFAVPYDEILRTHFNGYYMMLTVKDLEKKRMLDLEANEDEEDLLVNVHYGDWPDINSYVFN